MDTSAHFSETARHELISSIGSAAERLNRLVENLLDMSRLESGRLQLKRDWCDVSEIIAGAVKHLEHDLRDHPVSIRVMPNLPLVQVDFALVEQVIVNLLDNACRYTPVGTSITLQAEQSQQQVMISIRDNGTGIPEADLERVFDKFYRVPGTASGGTGLGLSISRGLIEAHGGTLVAHNHADGGAELVIRLPLLNPPPPVKEAVM